MRLLKLSVYSDYSFCSVWWYFGHVISVVVCDKLTDIVFGADLFWFFVYAFWECYEVSVILLCISWQILDYRSCTYIQLFCCFVYCLEYLSLCFVFSFLFILTYFIVGYFLQRTFCWCYGIFQSCCIYVFLFVVIVK